MRAADKSVVAGVDDDGVVGDPLGFELFADHRDRLVNRVDQLVVLGHDLVVTVVVPPTAEAAPLPSLLALRRHVRARGPAVVLGLGERLARVHVVELGVGLYGPVRRLVADRHAEGLVLLYGLADGVAAERSVRQRGVRELLGVGRHGLVLGGLVAGLAGPAAVLVEVVCAEPLALDEHAELTREGRVVAGLAHQDGIRLGPDLGLHVAVSEVRAGLVLVHPGEHVGPAGHADRRGVVMTVEGHPVPTDLVHVGRLHFGVAVDADRQGVLIVRKQEDDVGLFGGGGGGGGLGLLGRARRGGAARRGRQQQHHHRHHGFPDLCVHGQFHRQLNPKKSTRDAKNVDTAYSAQIRTVGTARSAAWSTARRRRSAPLTAGRVPRLQYCARPRVGQECVVNADRAGTCARPPAAI